MVLGPQRLGEAPHHVELAGDGLEVGVVAQGDDRADLATLPERRRRADDQDVLSGHVDVVRLGGLSDGGIDQRRGKPQLAHRAADHVLGQVEQSTCLVVDELHPVLVVEEQQALADGMEHGVVVLVHASQLLLAQTVGLAPQPTADQPGAEQPDRQHGRAASPIGTRSGERLVDLLDGDADRDQGDDRSPSITGTTERIEGPSVPAYSWVKTRPSGASPRSPMNFLPICAGLGWV